MLQQSWFLSDGRGGVAKVTAHLADGRGVLTVPLDVPVGDLLRVLSDLSARGYLHDVFQDAELDAVRNTGTIWLERITFPEGEDW